MKWYLDTHTQTHTHHHSHDSINTTCAGDAKTQKDANRPYRKTDVHGVEPEPETARLTGLPELAALPDGGQVVEVLRPELGVVEERQRRALEPAHGGAEQAARAVRAGVQHHAYPRRPGVVRVLNELVEHLRAGRVSVQDLAQPGSQRLVLPEAADGSVSRPRGAVAASAATKRQRGCAVAAGVTANAGTGATHHHVSNVPAQHKTTERLHTDARRDFVRDLRVDLAKEKEEKEE